MERARACGQKSLLQFRELLARGQAQVFGGLETDLFKDGRKLRAPAGPLLVQKSRTESDSRSSSPTPAAAANGAYPAAAVSWSSNAFRR